MLGNKRKKDFTQHLLERKVLSDKIKVTIGKFLENYPSAALLNQKLVYIEIN